MQRWSSVNCPVHLNKEITQQWSAFCTLYDIILYSTYIYIYTYILRSHIKSTHPSFSLLPRLTDHHRHRHHPLPPRPVGTPPLLPSRPPFLVAEPATLSSPPPPPHTATTLSISHDLGEVRERIDPLHRLSQCRRAISAVRSKIKV